ncbi:MAG: ketopantoate reductase family protein [Alphaproteobacteria bacterium]|nr:ketopantoate reductase family protein [Alphaproteobacteria bacterium]
MSDEPVLIWGSGAIGGTLAAWWARAGVPLIAVDVQRDHVEACRTKGMTIEGPVDSFTQKLDARMPEEVTGTYRRIILAVKAQHTEAAVDALAKHVAPDGFVLSAQNGLNEVAIAKKLGAERTMGCFVNYSGDLMGPGRIMLGSRGSVVVGEIDGSIRERTRAMHTLLQVFEPKAQLTDNIWGQLWGKIAYSAMLFATSLNHDSMADNFADPARFPAFHRLGREVIAVAMARRVKPLGFGGFDPSAFGPSAGEAAARASIAWLVEFNRASAKTHSGVYRDLAVHKRRTAVDPQIGAVAELGREAGIDTPALRKLVELVQDIEDGRRPQSRETLQALVAVCEAVPA